MTEFNEEIKNQIKQRFAQVALRPRDETKFPVGPESAVRLGYASSEINTLPSAVTESFAGVGNVFSLGACQAGEVVLDLGCGSGMDTLLAARQVGPLGKVVGIDFSQAMVEKAKSNIAAAGFTNAQCFQGDADAMPFPDHSVERVISNGVFNLCVDKPKVLAEVFRVLKPGGRIQMADVLLHDDVTPDEVARKGAWSD
jgi:SAM-dependent methyltransferase